MREAPSERGETLLRIRGLSKSFGGFRMVDDVDLDIGYRGIKVSIGPNGAGKSTLFRLISGTLRHDRGTIALEGCEIGSLSAHKRQRLGIAQSFQVPRLASGLTVGEHIAMSSVTALSLPRSLLKGFKGSSEGSLVSGALEAIGLRAKFSDRIDELSHADRKKLDLCCAFLQLPKLLLLDEPTAGLNSHDIPAMLEYMLYLEGETSVLLIEHDMTFVRALKKEVVVLHQGRIVRSGDLQSLESDGFIREIYFGQHIQREAAQV